jgi:glucose/arabinose dehydrogenase
MNKFFSLILLWGTLAAKAQVPTLTLTQVASGFTRVTTLSSAPGDDRLFVCEKAGVIKFFRPYVGSASTTFLNINSRVVNISSDNDERGLLGLAFDPNYTQNGRFYVNYINNSGNTVIARYTVSATDPNAGNFDSEQILLTITQPYTNHNGGCLAFGPDGYLYIGMGDGGSGGDPQNYSQNPNSLLGKMLRIDVSGNDAGYTIPADNPFTAADDPTNSIRDEIWAIGVRNPWRWSFDRISGDMWIADVGQNLYEEVNVQPASSTGGENYGWRCYEANNTYTATGCLAQSNYIFPIYNYTHASGGCSITGGYVYRGNLYNDVFGRYFYTDYCDGVIRGIIPDGAGGYTNQSHGTFTQFQYTTFGEDQFGEVYIAQQNGVISRLTIAASLPRAVITASGPLTVCSGDGLELSTGLNPLLSYSWAKDGIVLSGATSATLLPIQSGSYTVTTTNSAGSSTSEALQITVNQLPGVSIAGINDAYCLNSPEVALILEPAGGELNGLGTNNANGTFSPELAGTGQVNISYTITDGNGCSNTASFDVIIDSCVGIESNKKQELAISPNPFGDFITISNAEQVKGSLKIVNALGQTVLAASLSGSTQTIGTHVLPKGSYFVVIQNASGQTVRKLIKN